MADRPETADDRPFDDIPFDLPPGPGNAANFSEQDGFPGDAGAASMPLVTLPVTVRVERVPPAARGASNAAQALARSAPPAAYLDGLNPEQRAAVEALDGPVLVLAGAGTGKTRVLTTRIAHILATGRAYPSQILAVTFTNKAAREMKERVSRVIGEGAAEGMPWLGTFHSIGVKMLRRHAELVGLKSGFTILDTDDQLRLMKQVIEAGGLDKDRWPARQLASLIDSWKNRGLAPETVPPGESFAFANGKGAALYTAYQSRLKELNACDFGDLLLESLRLLRTHPDILADYQRRFRYILVDEYQDTNIGQYLWLRLLAQGSPNIACVGDDDQSIYGWRGAEVDNILRFDKDFPGAVVVRLERNYRSTGHILAAASGLIAHNTGRLGKTLFTDGENGRKVALLSVWDDEEEARDIGETIEALAKTGERLNQIAILVRASFQMRVFEDRFITLGIPYRVIGGPRFYERAEIKDALAYLEVTANPLNDLKFERIVNVPKRGLGDTTVKRIHELARAREIPLVEAAREMAGSDEIGAKSRRTLASLLQSFSRWRDAIATMKHTELAELILDESGYTAMWQADKSPQAASRLENLKELVRFMHAFDTLASFLEHASLVAEAGQGNDGERVSVMTLHAAKGLEFDTVFLPGWEEGLFPHQRALDEAGGAGLEEERRLAYVGLTRARKFAKVSFAQNRRTRGLYQSALPSRFIDELPAANLDIEAPRSPFSGATRSFGTFGNPFGASRFDRAAGGGDGNPGADRSRTSPRGAGPFGSGPLDSSPFGSSKRGAYDTPGWQRAQAHGTSPSGQGTQPVGPPKFGPPKFGQRASASNQARPVRREAPIIDAVIEGELFATPGQGTGFAVGDRVFHEKKFGYGRVTAVDGKTLTIQFDKAGEKRVMETFVERA